MMKQTLVVGAAMDLFVAKGFDQVTVAEIAQSSGVSRRTVFRLFPHKSDIVFPNALEIYSEYVRRFADLSTQVRVVDAIRITSELVAPKMASHPNPIARAHLLRSNADELAARHAQMYHMLTQDIVDILSPRIPARQSSIILGGAFGAMEQAIWHWQLDPSIGTPSAIASEIVHQFWPLLEKLD